MNEENKQDAVSKQVSTTEEKQKSKIGSRLERLKLKKQKRNEEHEDNEKNVKWVQIRLIPIWLRTILVLLLLVVVATIGLYTGYSVIGDGDPGDVFKKATWTHITDIIKGKE
ncbi:DNA-directed RNA polymerase subunit beta [Sporosarcina pasteurii]|uniref:DNA-directed RNA polymerase subunit beta n=1 Tax=Sporosarcina pasteurii TaxID=1474 RepID=A0A380BDN1_SPOPA|nr:DNA-directed RNA polymerase subunit beta [Sporosarcina pasteurii]MDS9472259.1 DNA-directed RNA polymerase subunit beta [Sporosarcina pasteurii]QBQ06241.1 DNA-directed RNA polymerase subunit beta [Sporosarcina pasteurii]SUI99119.1 DNA-directed RNA polymerase subunit beta [Sporosarcina pasteurii]